MNLQSFFFDQTGHFSGGGGGVEPCLPCVA
jgi:hypothetical protein